MIMYGNVVLGVMLVSDAAGRASMYIIWPGLEDGINGPNLWVVA